MKEGIKPWDSVEAKRVIWQLEDELASVFKRGDRIYDELYDKLISIFEIIPGWKNAKTLLTEIHFYLALRKTEFR